MSDNSGLIKHLEIVSQTAKHHHDAIWEEEKHYSWWVYIILAGLIYIYVNVDGNYIPKNTLITIGGLFGIYLSLAAIKVIRREGDFLYQTLEKCNWARDALGLNQPIQCPNGEKCVELKAKFDTKKANKGFKEFIDFKHRLGIIDIYQLAKEFITLQNGLRIRDIFQVTFVIAAILFVILIVLSWVQPIEISPASIQILMPD
ncbi:hypothetical protein ACFLX7_00150 [Chloroflexota bacterium]